MAITSTQDPSQTSAPDGVGGVQEFVPGPVAETLPGDDLAFIPAAPIVENAGAEPAPRQPAPGAEPTRTSPIASVSNRDAIAAKLEAKRALEREQVSEYTHPELPPAAEPAPAPAPASPPAAQTQAPAVAPAQPQRPALPAGVKEASPDDLYAVTVDGQTVVKRFRDIIAENQKHGAADARLREANELLARARQGAATPTPERGHHEQVSQTATLQAPLSEQDVAPLAEVIRDIQLSEPEDAAKKFAAYLADRDAKAARNAPDPVAVAMGAMSARSAQEDQHVFFQEHQEYAQDENRAYLFALHARRELEKDLLAIGVPAGDLAQVANVETLRDMHANIRSNPKVDHRLRAMLRPTKSVLDATHRTVGGIFGAPVAPALQPVPASQQPAPVAPRSTRAQNAQPQPTQRATPRPNAPPAPPPLRTPTSQVVAERQRARSPVRPH